MNLQYKEKKNKHVKKLINYWFNIIKYSCLVVNRKYLNKLEKPRQKTNKLNKSKNLQKLKEMQSILK